MRKPKINLKRRNKSRKNDIVKDLYEEEITKEMDVALVSIKKQILAIIKREIKSITKKDEELIKKLIEAKVKNDISDKNYKKLRLDIIARQTADKFNYNDIIAAIDDESEGAAVHGDLMKRFKDYDHLISEDFVLSRAAHYAYTEWLPPFIFILLGIDPEEYEVTKIFLDEKQTFPWADAQPFDRAFILAPSDLNSSVYFEIGAPEIVHNYPVKANVGYANIAIVTWVDVETPLILIMDAPGTNCGLYKTTLLPKDVENKTITLQREEINDLKKQLEPYKANKEIFEGKMKVWRRWADDAITESEDVLVSNLDKNINAISEADNEDAIFNSKKDRNYTGIIFGIIFGILGSLALIVWIMRMNAGE